MCAATTRSNAAAEPVVTNLRSRSRSVAFIRISPNLANDAGHFPVPSPPWGRGLGRGGERGRKVSVTSPLDSHVFPLTPALSPRGERENAAHPFRAGGAGS